MQVKGIKTSIFKEGENLEEFIVRHVKKLPEKSVLIITSKIVALSENRTAELKDRERLIKEESSLAIRTKYTWLTIKDGAVMSSAGIDESNANGKLILLPKDSYKTASEIRKFLQEKYKVKNIGVLITDSRIIPLRAGVTGISLGYAGFKGIRDYRKKPDIFNKKFEYSRLDIADSLASTAVLEMGEGNEQKPLAIINGVDIEFCEKVYKKELYIDPKEDMYRPLFLKLPKK